MPTSLLREHIDESVAVIRKHTPLIPDIAIIMGTGLARLADIIEVECVLPYKQIPHFPLATVETHKGKLLLGTLNEKNVVAMQGRFHYYEGYTMQQITFPIRVMKALGAKTLIMCNATGGLNPRYKKGDIIIIDDHINLQGDNPLIGQNDNTLGQRFPDMIEPYSHYLIELAEKTAREKNIVTQRGVYVSVAGPNLETKAEYRFLKTIGADVVGMSTVPETIVAVHSDMRVLAFSIVTDECFPDALKPVSVEDIIATANKAEPALADLIMGIVGKL